MGNQYGTAGSGEMVTVAGIGIAAGWVAGISRGRVPYRSVVVVRQCKAAGVITVMRVVKCYVMVIGKQCRGGSGSITLTTSPLPTYIHTLNHTRTHKKVVQIYGCRTENSLDSSRC